MKQIIFSLFVIGMIATTACQQEYIVPEVHIHLDSCKIVVNGDSITINNNTVVEGDSIVNENHLHNSPEVEVNGGDVNNTNTTITNGNGGGSGNNNNPTNSSSWRYDSLLIKIPVQDFHKGFLYERLTKESTTSLATFATTVTDTTSMLALGFFDASNIKETTLAFPTKIPAHQNNGVLYPSIKTKGKFGADEDRTKRIVALNIDRDEGWGEMVDLGSHENGIDYGKLTGDVYLSGFAAGQGNNPDYATGRTLIGTDGEYVYILHLKSATSKGAEQTFKKLNICPPPYGEVAGGSFANGLKPSALRLRFLE